MIRNKLLDFQSQTTALPFSIEELSSQTIDAALTLVEHVFKNIKDEEKMTLVASLQPQKYKHIFEENEVKSMQYWVAKDKTSQKVIGLTGLYTEIEDSPNDCWLGWLCVDPKHRKKGYGKKLLEFSEMMAMASKKKNLLIYTYATKAYHNAIKLYEQQGYVLFDMVGNKYKRNRFFKKSLCK